MKRAEWLDFHIERRNAGDTSDCPVQRLTLTVEEAAETLGLSCLRLRGGSQRRHPPHPHRAEDRGA
jgi:hypothetical protein